MIDMIEPTDPAERKSAIRICRANAYLDVDTGEPIDDREKGLTQWMSLVDDLPYRKWIWVWNYAKKEWDPRWRVSDQSTASDKAGGSTP